MINQRSNERIEYIDGDRTYIIPVLPTYHKPISDIEYAARINKANKF